MTHKHTHTFKEFFTHSVSLLAPTSLCSVLVVLLLVLLDPVWCCSFSNLIARQQVKKRQRLPSQKSVNRVIKKMNAVKIGVGLLLAF